MSFILTLIGFSEKTKEPKIDPLKDEKLNVEYLKLWMEQSKLMWSRLQFVHLIHAGVLGGWMTLLNKGHIVFSILVLSLGPILSWYLITIIQRDAGYLDAWRRLSNDSVPKIDEEREFLNGRKCAYWMIYWLSIIEMILITILIFLFIYVSHSQKT